MKKLRIADTLSMPLDAVTQKITWLGRTGSGKTYGCKRFVEQMLEIKAQVVILDGSGAWAGLRLGKKAFKIPVFGGLYGDIPLEPTGGALVADVVVDRRTSMVIDVSQMLDAERTRFSTAFAQRFFFRKKSAPSAVHVVLEECQDFVPENPQKGEERMLHEFQRLAKQGRPHGIGMSFISQRPQEISKKALNQVECVFAFQMNGPHERKAIQYWLSDKGFEGEKLSDILPHLEVGAPHVWSPQWLKVSKVVHMLPISSLDTSRTPKVGEKKFKQKTLRPMDLKVLKDAMAETIERAKLEDPTEFKKQIAERDRRIRELEKAKGDAKGLGALAAVRELKFPKGVVLKEFEVVVDRRHLEETIQSSEALEERVQAFKKIVSNASDEIVGVANMTTRAVRRARQTGPAALAKRLAKTPPASKRVAASSLPIPITSKMLDRHEQAMRDLRTKSSNGAGTAIGGGLRRMMIALAQRPQGLTSSQLSVRSGMSQSGTFSTYLSRARTEGWIEYDGDRKRITESGVAALGGFEPLPEGRELLEYWLKELGGGASRMLAALAEAPGGMTNEELATAAEMNQSGTFATYLSKLRKLELVEGRGTLRMSEELS